MGTLAHLGVSEALIQQVIARIAPSPCQHGSTAHASSCAQALGCFCRRILAILRLIMSQLVEKRRYRRRDRGRRPDLASGVTVQISPFHVLDAFFNPLENSGTTLWMESQACRLCRLDSMRFFLFPHQFDRILIVCALTLTLPHDCHADDSGVSAAGRGGARIVDRGWRGVARSRRTHRSGILRPIARRPTSSGRESAVAESRRQAAAAPRRRPSTRSAWPSAHPGTRRTPRHRRPRRRPKVSARTAKRCGP